ncbi:hypothetical protein FKM82_015685 [Ascaphus truei]
MNLPGLSSMKSACGILTVLPISPCFFKMLIFNSLHPHIAVTSLLHLGCKKMYHCLRETASKSSSVLVNCTQAINQTPPG